MRFQKFLSMIAISVYICLFSVCRGAAVDAPKTTTTETTTASLSTTTETSSSRSAQIKSEEHENHEDMIELDSSSRAHPRFARSVPAPESVLNYLPSRYGRQDYETRDNIDTWSRGVNGHVSDKDLIPSHKLPVSSLSDSRGPHGSTWQLEPQVGKRGKRVRGGQSFYRRDPSEGHVSHTHSRSSEDYQLMSDSLDAVERGAAETMLARQQRNGRRYDVPQIGKR